MDHDIKLVKAIAVSPGQMRAARGLIGWSQTKLSVEARLSLPTVARFEADKGPNVSDDAVTKMRRALEAAGVEFTNGDEPGVKLNKKGKRN